MAYRNFFKNGTAARIASVVAILILLSMLLCNSSCGTPDRVPSTTLIERSKRMEVNTTQNYYMGTGKGIKISDLKTMPVSINPRYTVPVAK